MFTLQNIKTKAPATRGRKNEIVAQLSAFNLKNGLRVWRANYTAADFARNLRSELESLGATFTAFANYLGSRIDLLPAAVCLELSKTESKSLSLSFSDVREIFINETARPPENEFLYLAEEPFEIQNFFQKHRAFLPDETEAVVKITNPEAEKNFLAEAEYLNLLASSFTRFMSQEHFSQAVEDFRRETVRQFDLRNEARDITPVKDNDFRFSTLRTPRVFSELSAAKVLTVERLKGTKFSDLLNDKNKNSSDANEAARLLCSVWFEQALYGESFPVVTGAENVILTDDKRIAFTDCAFSKLEPETQFNLRRYLTAALTEQIDRAADFWLKEFAAYRKADELNLRRHLRQIVVFRDSDWYQIGLHGEMLDLLILQWRAATENGFKPMSDLPSFYRGFFGAAGCSERLAPNGSSLIEGLEDARLLANLSDFGNLLSVQRLASDAGKYGSVMYDLPGRIDEFLRNDQAVEPRKISKPARKTAGLTMAVMLLAGAVVLLAPKLSAMFEESVWSKRLGVIAFLLCGIWLLRSIGRAE